MLEEMRRDMTRLALVRDQVVAIEQARLARLEQTPASGPQAMVALLARVVGVGIETADMSRRCSAATCETAVRWRVTPG
jgi:transposase